MRCKSLMKWSRKWSTNMNDLDNCPPYLCNQPKIGFDCNENQIALDCLSWQSSQIVTQVRNGALTCLFAYICFYDVCVLEIFSATSSTLCNCCSATLSVYNCKGLLIVPFAGSFDCFVCLTVANVCWLRSLHELL